MKLSLLQIGLVLFLFSFCNCNKHAYSADKLPDEQLLFGEGGGFTGAVTTYMLLQNGQLFRVNSMQGDTTEIAKVEKKSAKMLLKEAKEMEFNKMNIQEPGNVYYFVGLRDGKETYKATWGNPEYTIDPKIQSFYKRLMETTKQAKAPEK